MSCCPFGLELFTVSSLSQYQHEARHGKTDIAEDSWSESCKFDSHCLWTMCQWCASDHKEVKDVIRHNGAGIGVEWCKTKNTQYEYVVPRIIYIKTRSKGPNTMHPITICHLCRLIGEKKDWTVSMKALKICTKNINLRYKSLDQKTAEFYVKHIFLTMICIFWPCCFTCKGKQKVF